MKNKLFKKDIPHACKHCLFSHEFDSDNEVLCSKRGVVSVNDSCRKYKYDVLKRTPRIASLGKNYKEEDFIL